MRINECETWSKNVYPVTIEATSVPLKAKHTFPPRRVQITLIYPHIPVFHVRWEVKRGRGEYSFERLVRLRFGCVFLLCFLFHVVKNNIFLLVHVCWLPAWYLKSSIIVGICSVRQTADSYYYDDTVLSFPT